MRKYRISALLLAAAIALIPAAGCRNKNKTDTSSNNTVPSGYAAHPDIGKNQINVGLNENADVNPISYTLNNVIDSGKVQDGLKYIYLDVTIKNDSNEEYIANGINNFYLLLDDGTEKLIDVRADIYAKQYINDYVQLTSIPAGGEYSGYIGFCLDENIDSFKVGFFPEEDKESVIFCDISANDIIPAPEGMISDTPKSAQ